MTKTKHPLPAEQIEDIKNFWRGMEAVMTPDESIEMERRTMLMAEYNANGFDLAAIEVGLFGTTEIGDIIEAAIKKGNINGGFS